MGKKCKFGLKIDFDWPLAQLVNLDGPGSVHLTILFAVRFRTHCLRVTGQTPEKKRKTFFDLPCRCPISRA